MEEETETPQGAKTVEELTHRHGDQITGPTDGGQHAMLEGEHKGEVPNSHKVDRQTRKKHAKERVVITQKYVKDPGI